jgi:phage-related protein|nr:MAG TPA: distal tail protein [Caudoviricetes sp.]
MFNLFQDERPRVMVNDVDLSMFDLCVMDRVDIPTPERQTVYSENKFDYRGTKRHEAGWKDIDISVTLNYLNTDPNNNTTFRKEFYTIRTFLLKAKSLRFNDDLPVVYKVKAVKINEAKSEILEHGVFTAIFTCDPFPYKRDDKIEFTLAPSSTPVRLINDGNHRSFPIIRMIPVLKNGETTYPTRVVCNIRPVPNTGIPTSEKQWTFIITDFNPTVTSTPIFVIDSEKGVYYKTNNLNTIINPLWKGVEFDDFPSLEVGEYTINMTITGIAAPNFEMKFEIDRRLVY